MPFVVDLLLGQLGVEDLDMFDGALGRSTASSSAISTFRFSGGAKSILNTTAVRNSGDRLPPALVLEVPLSGHSGFVRWWVGARPMSDDSRLWFSFIWAVGIEFELNCQRILKRHLFSIGRVPLFHYSGRSAR